MVSGCPTADKVNHLKLISLVDKGLRPEGARDDLSVMFYGNPIPLQV